MREWLPRAVNFFGPPGSGFTYDCLRYGLKSRDNAELAELYLSMLERRVVQAGLEMPRPTPRYPPPLGFNTRFRGVKCAAPPRARPPTAWCRGSRQWPIPAKAR